MRAVCVFIVVVRRNYIIIIRRLGGFFVCVFRGRGCCRFSKPTVICRFFRVDVRYLRCCLTSGYCGFVVRCLRRVGTCCLMGFMGNGILCCSVYFRVVNCY